MKYTVITGSSRGIGKELAHVFAKKSHNLILIARSIDKLEELALELMKMDKINVVKLICDLNDLNAVEEVFTEINNKYEIECLINNAGMGIFEEIKDLSIETIENQINLNVNTPILITRILIDNLMRNKASIINVCSALSYLPNIKSSVYTASKYALYGFSNCIRLEYPKLHVLTVHPITVRTNFFNDPQYFDKIKKIIEPGIVANRVYKAYKRKRRKCNIPASIGLLNLMYQLFPRTIDYLNRKFYSNK